MRTLAFTKRTAKEIILDPLSVIFGIGFPVVLLLLLSAINSGIPDGHGPDNFKIENLAPSITVFGISFITLFAALLISKDRGSSLLQRLFTTPLKAADFIAGYLLPLLPIGVVQTMVCCLVALILGLEFSAGIFLVLPGSLLITMFYASLGLLCGTLMNEKQVGGLCGALVTNITAWFSGAWFSLEMIGGVYETIGKCLPFYHMAEIQKALLNCSLEGVLSEGHLWIVLAYTVVLTAAAVLVFTFKMKEK